MNKQELIELINSLNFPKEEYFVLGGGSLLLHNLRETTKDIDLCISEELFQKIKNQIDLSKKNSCNFYPLNDKVEVIVNPKETFDRQFIEGYPAEKLENILKYKKQRNKEKDKADIIKIKEYLENQKNGIILLDKPKGITSRDAVNQISKALNIKKVGHNGTLDPLATGLLVICLGKYTKLNDILTHEYKEYIAEVTLGIETDTLDIEGKIIKEENCNITKEQIENALNHFKKTYLQEVPKYSAVKINGKKLYEYARNNQDVNLPKREVTIEEIKLLDFKDNKFTFICKVSKGTYIRSLIRDICHHLNIIGTMSNLKRTKQGQFNLNDAVTLENIKQGDYKTLKIKDFMDIEIVEAHGNLKNKILNGQKLNLNYDKVLFVSNNQELALYKQENNELKVWKMLHENK